MHEFVAPHGPSPKRAAFRDLTGVVLTALVAGAAAAWVELNEAFMALAAPHERFQLDELPYVLIVLVAGLAWFAWRRYGEAARELAMRRRAEARLAEALDENRRLAQRYVLAQEAEHRALARDLHDELGQHLNAIKIEAVTLRDSAREDRAEFRSHLSAMLRMTDHLHAIVRDLVRRLRPVALDELGLAAALEHCVDGWRGRMRDTVFGVEIDETLEDLGEHVNVTLYRLMQEGLTNVAKHARASAVRVTLARCDAKEGDRGAVRLSIQDNGAGARLPIHSSGLGLIGMRERVESLGGVLVIETHPGRGFSIQAQLPLDRAPQRVETAHA